MGGKRAPSVVVAQPLGDLRRALPKLEGLTHAKLAFCGDAKSVVEEG
jgi:hypothetical protein